MARRRDEDAGEGTTMLATFGRLGLFSALSAIVAAVGGRVTSKPKNKAWYRAAKKSALTPPEAAFGAVWPGLYSLGAWSASRVAGAPRSPDRDKALALFGAQLACNAAWSPTFFGAHRPRLALAVLLGNVVTLGAYAYYARRVDGLAAAAVIPNLAWLGYAGYLNATFITKNAHGPTRALVRG